MVLSVIPKKVSKNTPELKKNQMIKREGKSFTIELYNLQLFLNFNFRIINIPNGLVKIFYYQAQLLFIMGLDHWISHEDTEHTEKDAYDITQTYRINRHE